jgi:hypothetical protein
MIVTPENAFIGVDVPVGDELVMLLLITDRIAGTGGVSNVPAALRTCPLSIKQYAPR